MLLLQNEPTPEANRYGVGSAACLKLREQMAHVRLDRLLGQEERSPISRFTRPSATSWSTSISRAVGSCSSSRSHGGVNGMTAPRRPERAAPPPRRSGGVIAVPVQDLLALSSVHVSIGVSAEL